MEKKTFNNLVVSASPHIVSSINTTRVMLCVIIALLPSLIASIGIFGIRAALLAAVCIVSALFFEWIWNVIFKKKQTIGDLSAVVTGLLLAMNCPVTLPLWIGVLGSGVAIIVVKQLYGGLGKNLVNPAIAARIILLVSFATPMASWTAPKVLDTVSGATPLATLAETGETTNLVDMLLGLRAGSMGEVCSIALIIGGIFLIVTKVISPIIPVSFIGSVFVYGLIASKSVNTAVFYVLAGGVLLGAFFMATDYVTTPMTKLGKLIFGIGCGVLTMLIRLNGAYPEGVSFAILIMNCLTPLIDNLCRKIYIKGGIK